MVEETDLLTAISMVMNNIIKVTNQVDTFYNMIVHFLSIVPDVPINLWINNQNGTVSKNLATKVVEVEGIVL